jgi:hypothetical protein
MTLFVFFILFYFFLGFILFSGNQRNYFNIITFQYLLFIELIYNLDMQDLLLFLFV